MDPQGGGPQRNPAQSRPVHHRLEDRVRTHVPLCMQALGPRRASRACCASSSIECGRLRVLANKPSTPTPTSPSRPRRCKPRPLQPRPTAWDRRRRPLSRRPDLYPSEIAAIRRKRVPEAADRREREGRNQGGRRYQPRIPLRSRQFDAEHAQPLTKSRRGRSESVLRHRRSPTLFPNRSSKVLRSRHRQLAPSLEASARSPPPAPRPRTASKESSRMSGMASCSSRACTMPVRRSSWSRSSVGSLSIGLRFHLGLKYLHGFSGGRSPSSFGLASGQWIRDGQSVLLVGPTGSGKSYVGLLAPAIRMTHHHVDPPTPRPVPLAKPALPVAVGIRLQILEPQTLQRHPLVSRQLAVDQRPVRLQTTPD